MSKNLFFKVDSSLHFIGPLFMVYFDKLSINWLTMTKDTKTFFRFAKRVQNNIFIIIYSLSIDEFHPQIILYQKLEPLPLFLQ